MSSAGKRIMAIYIDPSLTIMEPSRGFNPNPFFDEDDNNPHDERLERALADQGASLGDVQELNAWGNRPQTDQEVLDAIFAPKRDPASDGISPVAPNEDKTAEGENDPAMARLHAMFAVPKKETPPDGKTDLSLGEVTDTGAGATVKEAHTDISPEPAPMPSTLKSLGTAYSGSPNDNSTGKRMALAINPSKHTAGHNPSYTTDPVDKFIGMTDSMIKEGHNQLNSPTIPVDDNTSSAMQVSETPASTSTTKLEDLNHSVWAGTTAKFSSTEKPASMAQADWLKKLHGVAAPDYDGEWEDSPSRGPVLIQKKLFEEAEIAEPVATSANTPESRLVSSVASNSRGVAPAATASEEELDDELEDIDLDSPVKKAVEKPTKKPSVASNANKENTTGGFTKATLGKQPTTSRPSLVPKTPKVPSPAKLVPLPTLGTTGASPMPTYTQIKAQADHNLKRRSAHVQAPPKSPIDSDQNLIDGEYADVSMDMLDHEMANCGLKDYPTYHFPGTYDAAKHDTYEAVKNVSSAACSFGSALGVAGVGKAIWSVGTLVGKGARRTGKVVATTATMSAIKLGYKESLPASVAQWAEETSYKEARKAEKTKPVYKMAGVQYKKGDPRNYVLDKNPYAVQQNSIDFDDDLDEDDWTMVKVKEGADKQTSPRRVHGEQPPVDYQDKPRVSVYENVMTAVENTATVTTTVASRVGRNVSRAVRTVRAQPHDLFEQQKIAENWPKDLKELEFRNKTERRRTIPGLTNTDSTKLPDTMIGKVSSKRPNVTETDEDSNNFDGMVLSDGESMN
ncbi:hypothetical protein P171DRAFT_520841 [Karstenula rhodostoma CBS 690.94]|uniref:Uncharacterized protein n=1 Tax=Karstenula rhodostoma CBS 690.94 TaxID=1392251 RepID=A0A9P4PIP6_9PLEO|nr:hypothetical protein P171DRAFT_520841 [Karstenula rhodostoma CBS 690.94]